MTESDWDKAISGNGDREVVVNGQRTRVRFLVADAINVRAKQLQKTRPDKAGVLYKIEGKVRDGNVPSKGTLVKAWKELEIARQAVVDGEPLVDG